MNPNFSSAALWLADFHLLAMALLAGTLLALAAVAQPARRMAIARGALAAIVLAAVLSAIPGWSLIHLASAPAALPTPPPAVSTPREPAANDAPPAPVFTQPAEQTLQPVAVSTSVPTAASPAAAAPWPWTAILLGAYGALSSATLLWLVLGAVLARRLRRRATPAPRAWQTALVQLAGPALASGRLRRAPELLASREIDAPVALGLLRPAIVLPASIDAEAVQPQAILAHELAHIQNGDLRTLLATRSLLALLWPQPLFWLLRRAIRLDQETLADAAAAALTSRVDYAEQLVAWARSANPSAGESPRSRAGRRA